MLFFLDCFAALVFGVPFAMLWLGVVVVLPILAIVDAVRARR